MQVSVKSKNRTVDKQKVKRRAPGLCQIQSVYGLWVVSVAIGRNKLSILFISTSTLGSNMNFQYGTTEVF